MTEFSLDNQSKLAEIEYHLSRHPFLAGSTLPGSADAKIFNSLTFVPDKKIYPNFFFWYRLIKQFSLEALKNWQAREIKPDEQNNMGIVQENSREELSYYNSPEKEGTSDILFEIKPTSADINLNELAQKVLQIKQEGVSWDNSYKQVPIAFGTTKLQMKCTLSPQRVPIDELLQKIQSIDGVQSAYQRSPSQLKLDQ